MKTATFSPDGFAVRWQRLAFARPLAALGLLLATAGATHAQTAATFAPAATYGTGGAEPTGSAVADVNGDGKPDLLIANSNTNSNTVGVLLGTGTGTFQTATTYSSGGNSPVSLAVADINGDGKLDVLVTNGNGGTVGVLLGTGTGTFQNVSNYATGGNNPYNIAVADVNGDGKLDVLVVNASAANSTVGVLLGTGTGAFQAVTTYSSGGSTPYGLAVADVNGDGKLDVLTSNSFSNTVGVLLGTGTGAFPTATTYATGGVNPRGLVVADVNGDGRPDVLVTNGNSNTVGVLLGTSTGTFQAVSNYPTGGFNSRGLAVADVNGDGKLDVLTSNLSSGTASVLLGTGTGTFQTATTYSSGGDYPYSIAAADVNGDGKPDLLVPNFLDNDAGVLLNTTTYAAPVLTSLSPTSGPVGTSVTLTGQNLSSATAVRFNGTTASFTANSDGTLTATVPAGATTGTVSVTTPGGTANGPTFTVGARASTWTGTLSTDWFTAGNWSAGVPTAMTDATIPAGTPFSPSIASGTAASRALTLGSGATLSMSGGTLDAQGQWTNNGTFAATGGTVQLGVQTGSLVGSSTTTFWNLTTAGNAVDLNTSAGLAVQRLLTTNTSLNTNGNLLTLLSDASGTALAVNPTGGVGVIGSSAQVQRYIGPAIYAGAGYRHLSSPTFSVSNSQGTMFSDLATASFTPVVNPAYNTAAAPGTTQPFPNIFGYDQSRLATASNNLSAFDKGYYSPNSTSDRMTSGLGYTVNLAANQAVTFKGQLGYGDLTRSLSRNVVGTANAASAGWQLLGNPYPSPYNYGLQAASDRQNLDAAIYVYTATGPYVGQYRAILGTIGDPVLPMGQAFFARVSNMQTSGSLTFRNANRVTSYQNPTYQRPTETRPLVQLALASPTSTLADAIYVYFENGATDGYEPTYDALKLPNPTGLNLSTSVAGQQLAIDGRAPLASLQRVVPLAVGVPAVGSYTLTAAQLLNLTGVPVYLRDLLSGAVVDLAQQPSYSFTVSNAAALVQGRFELVFSPQQPLATASAALAQQVGLYPNPAQASAYLELPARLGTQAVTATLVDAVGRAVRAVTLPAQGSVAHSLDLRGLPTGVYTLRLSTSAGSLVKKLTVE